jgi:hypothetical protein
MSTCSYELYALKYAESMPPHGLSSFLTAALLRTSRVLCWLKPVIPQRPVPAGDRRS